MRKQEFLDELRRGLSGLPQADVEERLTFYGEMIDDRVEEGLSEEEAVNEIGKVEDVVSQIVAEIPLTKIVKETIKPKRAMRAWEIVLLILGFPLWFPLLIAAFAVLFSLYVVLWTLLISLWVVEVALCAVALGLLVVAIGLFILGQLIPAFGALGAALILAAASILLFFVCKAASKGVIKLTGKIALWIKSLFIRKERTK